MKQKNTIEPKSYEICEYVTAVREYLHTIPELGNKEFKTQAFLCEQLLSMGYKPKKLQTGIVVNINGRDNKKIIALRADMDALPIEEKNDVKYRSSHNGVMHACGHDGHMALLLGVAKLCLTSEPSCKIRLIFQPAEECGGGAVTMIEAGVLEGVDLIFGLHLSPKIQAGSIATNSGAIFAGACDYYIEMLGKSRHAALKDGTGDAIRGTVTFYNAISTLFETDFSDKNLFHIGEIRGGTASNIVCENAIIKCTFRYFDKAVLDRFMLRQQDILNDIFSTQGVDHKLIVENVYPPLINDAATTELILSKGGDNIQACSYEFTAEDFAFYLEKTKGCYSWLGVGDEKHNYPLHSPKFDYVSQRLMTGLEYYKRLIF